MLAITEHPLQALQEAYERAKSEGKPKLVSFVKRINSADPLSLFYNGKNMFHGERFIWIDSEQKNVFVGFNHLNVITTERDKGRYRYIEKEWKRFTEQSIQDIDAFPQGTGPILFGGFSFDPGKKQSSLWKEFPSGKFFIPEFLYTKVDDKAFFTMNVLISENDYPPAILSWYERAEKSLFRQHNHVFSRRYSNEIVEKVDVGLGNWKSSVEKATTLIRNKEIEKVVLARELRVNFSKEVKTEEVLQSLIKEQPTSYIFAFESNQDCFVGASPEQLVKREDDYVFSTCLAGSIRRGKTAEEDEELGKELLRDEKNLLEHQVVVHMIKESLQKVCKIVNTPLMPSLYKTKHIQHLYTPVEGKVKEDVTLFSILEKLHPTPALGGYPQEKAKQVIRELELLDRGWYAAPIGWIDIQGNGEFVVGIRSGIIQQNEASLFAGCGIVAESDAENEYKETQIKFNPMLSALGGMIHDIN